MFSSHTAVTSIETTCSTRYIFTSEVVRGRHSVPVYQTFHNTCSTENEIRYKNTLQWKSVQVA